MRASGILIHISSLPSPYGIGTLGSAAFDFVDFLSRTKTHLWQILPAGPTGFGDSPYQSFSVFAGNPYFIDLDILHDKGFIDKSELDNTDFGDSDLSVDYEKLYFNRYPLLFKAYKRSRELLRHEMDMFAADNSGWLYDYAFFMALKSHFGGKPLSEWPDDIRLRTPEALNRYRELLAEQIDFQIFLQYQFFNQYFKLKKHANQKGIKIIGDMPIYVSPDSADLWASPQLFQLDENLQLSKVAGVPPDAFSASGQLWGNPLYDWKTMADQGYEWWLRRLEFASKMFDIIRIDHFRGFDEYYAIPYGEKTAVNGKWEKGPGMAFFKAVKEKLGTIQIIAEDLGLNTETVEALLKETGYPGMKVLQFAFDESKNSKFLPHKYTGNCVVYTGTHDNDTTNGWIDSAKSAESGFAKEYVNFKGGDFADSLIRLAWQSVANIAIAPMQDFLGLGKNGRMNTPSTIGCNWKWRLAKDAITQQLEERILNLNITYGRC